MACTRVAIAFAVAVLAGCSQSAVTPLPAQFAGSDEAGTKASYRLLTSFTGFPSGSGPAGLTAIGGVLYGTTTAGGGDNFGTIFERRASGKLLFLHEFKGGADGAQPEGALVMLGGTLYGTTQFGGTKNDGTVFAITPEGKERVVYAFKGGNDGANPVLGGLVVAGNALYGTTNAGGIPSCTIQNVVGCGTVFKLTPSGKERVLHRFGGGTDGACPAGSPIASGSALFGTTNFGGTHNNGTVYKITTSGSERVVYAFKGYPDGAIPYAGLTALGGAFYGTTTFGGSFNNSGTVYKVSASGTERVLHSFTGTPDGAVPFASLTVVNGELYGTTRYGGTARHSCVADPYSGCGTIFAIGTSGDERVIYRFRGKPDGKDPWSGPIAGKGALYGTTLSGGASDQGSIFQFSPGP